MIAVDSEIKNFNHAVKELISAWLSQPVRSKALLSKLSGLRPHAISEILNGSSLATYHPTRILKLLSVLERKEVSEVHEKYRNVIGIIEKCKNYKEVDSIDLELSSNKVFTSSFVESMRNPVALAIYTLSTSDSGVEESIIKERFGSYSMEVIRELIDKKIIVPTGGTKHIKTRYFATNTEMLHLDSSDIKKVIPSLNSFYSPDHAGNERNYIMFRVDSINRKALRKIHEAYSELDEKITKVLSDDAHKGTIPFYGFAQLDTFVDDIE